MQSALAFFGVDDFEHIFNGQRFKIQAIRGVVIRRYGFRIAVDHDRFIASVMQRETRMAAAIVKLNALADAVGSATENDDFLFVADLRLVAV